YNSSIISHILRQKIEITFIVSQTLIATIPFHHLSPNLVQLRETMAKSKSKKKGNLNSQPSSPQIDNRANPRAPVWRGQRDGEHVQAPFFISFYTKSSILTFTDSNITSFLYQNLSEI
ncbi:unnamed protein product, partial [Brassica oleracea var. botrytis]